MKGLIIGNNKRGQIWVETVIYTLIGLAIIGIVLTIAKPKIEEKKDSIVIEQAIEALKNIDSKITDVRVAEGNRRSIELKIGRGDLVIDLDEDKINWVIDSSFEYSEFGKTVPVGKVKVLTEDENPLKVILGLDYAIDLTYDGESSGVRQINSAPNPYTILVENKGRDLITGNLIIDISQA